MIPTTQHSGKGKSMETLKRSAAGIKGEGAMTRALGIVRALKLLCVYQSGGHIRHSPRTVYNTESDLIHRGTLGDGVSLYVHRR